MIKAELHPAYAWDCDACGKENFCRGIVCEPEMFSKEEEAEMREEMGIEPWEIGDWQLAPEEVKCLHCGAEYATRDFRDTTE